MVCPILYMFNLLDFVEPMIRNEHANVVTIANRALGLQQLKQYLQPIAVSLGRLSRHSCQVGASRPVVTDGQAPISWGSVTVVKTTGVA